MRCVENTVKKALIILFTYGPPFFFSGRGKNQFWIVHAEITEEIAAARCDIAGKSTASYSSVTILYTIVHTKKFWVEDVCWV